MNFENEYYLYLLWALPVFVLLFLSYQKKQRKIAGGFGNSKLVSLLASVSSSWVRYLKFSLLLVSFTSLVIAMANPRLPGERISGIGIAKTDIVFAIDVSKSMLATDVAPSRLARAQSFILSVLNDLHGEQVAVVIFAGKAESYVPLTTDYNYVKNAVKEISNNLVVNQGTLIRNALKISSLVLSSPNDHVKIISVLSDGETPETNIKTLVDTISHSGITFFAFGVGTRSGSNIIEQNGNGRDIVKHDSNGTPIISRLHEENLLKIVRNQPNRYYNLQDKDLASTMFVNEVQKLQHGAKTNKVAQKEYFQLFLLIAMVCLLAEIMII